jgi:serine/threonine protein kinase
MLLYFIPVTVITTPLGQLTAEHVSIDSVEVTAGVLVTLLAVFELYKKQELFKELYTGARTSWCCKRCNAVMPKVDDENNAGSWLRKAAEQDYSDDEDDEGDGRTLKSQSFYRRAGSASGQLFSNLYTLHKVLGEGGQATVKKGTHKSSGTHFAIKIIKKSSLIPESAAAMKAEIEVLQGLRHPRIVLLYDVFDEPETCFLVTEIMRGGDLLDRLTAVSCFSEEAARSLCQSILEAASYIHAKNIAHRDFKLENLLLAADWRTSHKSKSCVFKDILCDKGALQVKLADFGFAKTELQPNSLRTMCGTPTYTAPEVLGEIPYGTKCDCWSIGVVMYSLLAGYQPFRASSDAELGSLIMNGKLEFEGKFWGKISREGE